MMLLVSSFVIICFISQIPSDPSSSTEQCCVVPDSAIMGILRNFLKCSDPFKVKNEMLQLDQENYRF